MEVTYLHGAAISAEDIKEIYDYGSQQAGGEKYGILFVACGEYEVEEDALQYIVNNPKHDEITAKVYIISHQEAKVKTKLHIVSDKPTLIPNTFESIEDGRMFLKKVFENR